MCRVASFGLVVVAVFVMLGCQTTEQRSGEPVDRVWRTSRAERPRPVPRYEDVQELRTDELDPINTEPLREETAIAVVNGHKINRYDLIDLLIECYGLNVLEQVVVLELVKQEARTKNVSVTDQEIEDEYRDSLRAMAVTLSPQDSLAMDRATGESLLGEFLEAKNISRTEYMMGIERNAYLRKLVEKDFSVPPERIREEFNRLYGRRVEVRHIQLDSWPKVAEVRKAMDDGNLFEDVAKKYSTNRNTAPDGGLLPPFTIDDEDVPRLFRQAAFALHPGEVSNAVRVQDQYQVIKCIRRVSPQSVRLEDVKDELSARIRERLIPQAMQTKARALFEKARIAVVDSELKAQFQKKYPKKATVALPPAGNLSK